MKTSLDCLPCLLRTALEAARMASGDSLVRERVVRDLLRWFSEMDMGGSPPLLAQRIHRRLRELTGVEDPYREAKDRQNRMALHFLKEHKTWIEDAPDPLDLAVRLAIAANIIDLGAKTSLPEEEIRPVLAQAVREPVTGDLESFRGAAARARRILYLADNAGEIVFDRLLIERLSPDRVTLVVRGKPVINDATLEDARAAGLHEIVEVVDNGSDAPGTVLADCSPDFVRRFAEADLILAKGQGNYETLSDEPGNIFFLFKVKCPVVAGHVGLPVGAHVLVKGSALRGDPAPGEAGRAGGEPDKPGPDRGIAGKGRS